MAIPFLAKHIVSSACMVRIFVSCRRLFAEAVTFAYLMSRNYRCVAMQNHILLMRIHPFKWIWIKASLFNL